MPIIIPTTPGTTSITPSDLADMKDRIARELHRDDITTSIAEAISSAITKYQSRRFEFAESVSTFSTVADQQAYDSSDTGFPTDMGQVDSITVTTSGRTVPLEPISYQELKEIDTSTTLVGVPSKWCWYARSIWLYPTPDAIYTIGVSHQMRSLAPASDGDSSTIWTNECEPLIRACAKKLIARDVLYDEAMEARCERAEAEAFATLMHESVQLQDDGAGMEAQW